MDLHNKEDYLLLHHLKTGDEKSFRRAYVKYHKQLYGVAIKYLRNKELAEDAVHDIFVKLWNERKRLDTSGSLKGFLFTAVKNHVLNMMSSKKRKLEKKIQLLYEKKESRETADNIIDLSEYRSLYRSAVEQLPVQRREVFELRMDEGLTNAEVAQYLGVSIHTVKSQYYKAITFIKQYVHEQNKADTGT